ncbi:MAG TPA: outer membrane protein assembly factor BamD [Bryobacteraceae bacterium]|jgi:TolA-binding protein
MKRFAIPVLVLAALSWPVRAQNQKEMTLALQRDVSALQDQIKQMKASQEQRLAVIIENLRNTLDQAGRINEKMAVMQSNMNEKLNDVSAQVSAPTQHLHQKVDAMNDQFQNLSNTVAELNARLGKLDTKMEDVKKMVQTIPPPPAAAPQPVNQASAAEPAIVPAPRPPSADKVYEAAKADYDAGDDAQAMKGFNNFLVNFTADDHAPDAAFYIGEIYTRKNEFLSAIKAYDGVIDNFPDSKRVANARFMKAVSLAKLEKNPAAAKEFRVVIAKYPSTEFARKSREYLKALGMPVNQTTARKHSPTAR